MFFVGRWPFPELKDHEKGARLRIETTMEFAKSREIHRLQEPRCFPPVILGYAEVLSLPFGPDLESPVP
jgi:hypothetical protein